MLEVKNLCFYYGQKRILSSINLRIDAGTVTALIGPNGSGKSTLLRCMAGLLRPHSGDVFYREYNLKNSKHNWIARNICFLPQIQTAIKHLRVWELVAMGRSPYQITGWFLSRNDRKKISWALTCMDITHLQYQYVNKISGGEQQRAWLAMILAQDTDLILLDEPVTFLDMKYQWDLLELILKIRQQHNKTFIMVLHDINHAMVVADKVFAIKDGAVHASGRPSELITSNLLYEVYGVHAKIVKPPFCDSPIVVPELSAMYTPNQ